MKTHEISDTWGCLVMPSNSKDPQDLKYDDIVALFERYGVLVFRGFSLEPERITALTNRFTAKYSGEADRRPSRYGQKVVHDVDAYGMDMGKGVIGDGHVGWHSELDLDKGAKPILKKRLKEKNLPSISKKPFAGKKHLFSDQKLNTKFSNRIITSINSGRLKLPNINKK